MAEVMIAQSAKTCAKCRVAKPVTEFGVHARQKDGLQRNCAACQREYFAAYRDANRQAERDRGMKWRAAHPEAIAENRKKIRTERPTAEREYSAAYRARNPERRKESALKWARANIDQQRATGKAWREANPAKLAAKSSARRALKMRATPSWVDENEMLRVYEEAKRVSRETGIEHHVDHIVPLKSKLVCGLHCEANLQILTGSENLSKCNRFWPDMP